MNWKWYVGSAINAASHLLLSHRLFPITRTYPYGRSWMYDLQRFAETKDLQIAFDVGANVGQTAKGLIRYFPRASIYCFEPVSSSYTALVRTYGKFKNVRCIQKALGRSSGTASMQLRKDSESNTLINREGPEKELSGELETVSIDSLDSFCASENIGHIDILKMDVQGWEMEVLSGAQNMIDRMKIHFVYSEVAFRRTDSEMQHFAEINDLLEKKGFWLCGFYEPYRWGKHREFYGFSNALYVNPAFQRALVCASS